MSTEQPRGPFCQGVPEALVRQIVETYIPQLKRWRGKE